MTRQDQPHQDSARRICVGLIAAAHGVRGLVKLRSFTGEPTAIGRYGPLSDEAGSRVFAIELLTPAKDCWVARIDGVTDRTQAEALRGVHLFIDRGALPAPDEEEFYHADLIGLAAEGPDGASLGRVVAVHNFGAGDLLELREPVGSSRMVPFTRAVVPVIEFARNRLVVDLPVEVAAEGPPETLS